MEDRIKLRPVISSIDIDREMTEDEAFQNMTLRPILKMQHELFIAFVKSEILKKKNKYYQIKAEEKEAYLTQLLFRNTKNADLLRGMVLGHFTVTEYEYYSQNEKAVNKRITSMLSKRIIDSRSEYADESR